MALKKAVKPKTKTATATSNERGRRQSHAVRLTTGHQDRKIKVPGIGSPGLEVRERVLNSALECFGAFGFAGTSTRAVADRAGVSHPLLLYHFESKDGLWLKMMESIIGRYQDNLQARLSTAGTVDPVAGLKAFIENFVEFSAQVPQLHRIMIQQSTQGSDRIQWLIDGYLRASFENVCGMIRHGQDERRVRPGDPARLYYAVIGLAGTVLSVSTEFEILTKRNVFAPEELQQTIELIFDFLFVANDHAS
ncbi:MAG: TetR family transcriptional regulator [Gammaproteobacteria bacterium]|nr:TetR family transcriptional regulator [Gammaproteobacteria bacterium]